MQPRRTFEWMILTLGVAGCAGDSSLAVGWPPLESDELAFIVEIKDGMRQPALGPITADGPAEPIELTGSDEVILIVVDTRKLRALHPRVDASRWDRVRLVETVASCEACGSLCRDEAIDRFFHPVTPLSRALRLEGEAFAPLREAPFPTSWLELPATWGCVDVSRPDAFERVDRWPTTRAHHQIKALADGRLLVLEDGVRVVGADPEIFLPTRSGTTIRDLTSIDPTRLYAVEVDLDGSPSHILELELGENRIDLRREIAVPFQAVNVHLDERGLVTVGGRGQIATSTDTRSFSHRQVMQEPEVATVARLGRGLDPFLIGSGAGGVLRGDPWTPEREWSYERIDLNVDSTTREFLRTRLGETSVLWVRTIERGFFTQKDDGPWERLRIEMPRVHPRCRLRTDPCGFGEPPPRTRYSGAHESSVLTLADNCPALLIFELDKACTSSIELLEDGEPTERPESVIVEGDYVYVVLRDGVLRAPLSLIW